MTQIIEIDKSIKVFECPKCRFVGLYDEYWDGGIHSNDCPGHAVHIGWLCKTTSQRTKAHWVFPNSLNRNYIFGSLPGPGGVGIRRRLGHILIDIDQDKIVDMTAGDWAEIQAALRMFEEKKNDS